MKHHYPIQPYHSHPSHERQEIDVLLDAAKTGAVVGATGAAAANLHRIRHGEIDWQEAATQTIKVGFTAGVATAAATAVGRLFVRSPLLSLAATLATGTAVMYALNNPKREQEDE